MIKCILNGFEAEITVGYNDLTFSYYYALQYNEPMYGWQLVAVESGFANPEYALAEVKRRYNTA